EDLSEDLTKKYGRGFSSSNLRNMRKFYTENPIRQPVGELGWTKQNILFSIKDKKIRKDLKKKAITQNWPKRVLLDRVKKAKLDLRQDKSSIHQAPTKESIILKFTRGQLGLRRIVEQTGLHLNAPVKSLDLGFNLYQREIKGATRRSHNDIVELCENQGEYSLKTSTAKKSQLYTFKAFVERVVDGDTLLVNIDCGFNIWSRQRLRLRGINTLELNTEEGEKAKLYLTRILKQVNFIIIKTQGQDMYGRYLADVFYGVGESDAKKVLQEGQYLNQELLDVGVAVGWSKST
ncbi:MAG: hypothetical protein GY858_06920, partial [Candidatus Omnitrophica bacterium]|nr:hypothetical protein [Candidatus Omnitrophota bacterium]